MTEGEFPFRSFTMRSEGYDRGEVDSYIAELQGEIVEVRRALETATPAGESDARLHDPEGAVTRTLAIAQETADRVLHDAQIEADRRRSEADEHATGVVADADERAARLLGDMEAQAAEVREQGVAAARSAIQVERDKAMAELAHVRRVRDDLRTEAVDLKASLDRYRSQAREASDSLAAASSGPLMSLDLPDFVDDDVVLAGISSNVQNANEAEADVEVDDDLVQLLEDDDNESALDDSETVVIAAAVPDIEAPPTDASDVQGQELKFAPDVSEDSDDDAAAGDETLADVIAIGTDGAEADDTANETPSTGRGTFLAEVRAAAEDDDVALAPENDGSDRFLSELRGLTDDDGDELNSDAADTFFDDDK